MRKFQLLLTLLLFTSLIIFQGCKKDDDNPTGPGGQTGGDVTLTISGSVVDEFNEPVSGVEVRFGDKSSFTNTAGVYSIIDATVNKDRFVGRATKSSFFPAIRSEAVGNDTVKTVNFKLLASGTTKTISASTGGSAVLDNGSEVQIPSNGVVKGGQAYSGNIDMAVRYLDPTAENFDEIVPGGDLAATRTDNSSATLVSYGILKVNLSDENGEQLQLASGKESELTIDIPDALAAESPNTIPLWWFDETKGLWIEEGQAVKQGNKYVGTVKHFTDWNADDPKKNATIKGKVVDCNGKPVSGVTVQIGQVSTTTGADGTFSRRVPTQTPMTVKPQVQQFNANADSKSVPGLSEEQVYDVGSLSISCIPKVTGKIQSSTGGSIWGFIKIIWQGGNVFTYTQSDGSFEATVPANTDFDLIFWDWFTGGYAERRGLRTSGTGDLNLGIITVEQVVTTGTNSFAINGDGYNNRTFTIDSTIWAWGMYDASSNETTVAIMSSQEKLKDTVYIVFDFKGNQKGTYESIDPMIYINNKVYAVYNEGAGKGLKIVVNNYGSEGLLIDGTFSGNLERWVDLKTINQVSISNGQFSVRHLMDDKMKKPAALKKILQDRKNSK